MWACTHVCGGVGVVLVYEVSTCLCACMLVCVFVCVIGTEPRVLHMLGKLSSIKIYH